MFKKYFVLPFVAVLSLIIICSCSDDDDENNQPPYRIGFAVDGNQKLFEDNGDILISLEGSPCAFAKMPGNRNIQFAELTFCSDASLTSADIESWEGTEISFSSAATPDVSFIYRGDDTQVNYKSDYVADQTGSKLTVTGVVSRGDVFELTGTFNVKVASDQSATPMIVTDGVFVIPLLKPE